MLRQLAIATARAFAAAIVLFYGHAAGAQQELPSPPSQKDATAESGTGLLLLTVVLRHDQSKSLDEINAQLRRQGYYQAFPPPGVEIVSWYEMMGIGQVVTLRFPAERLRDVNRAIEQTAWGAFRTEFYPTYDYRALAEKERGERP